MDPWLDAMQWPAMGATLLAAWLVASTQRRNRRIGFWSFLASNVLWTVWGVHTATWSVVAMQFVLAAMNIRGAKKAEPQ